MSHSAVTAGTGWMLARQIGSARLREQAGYAHGRAVGEHDDEQAVELLALELAHDALGVLAVLDRRRDVDLGDAGERRGDVARRSAAWRSAMPGSMSS